MDSRCIAVTTDSINDQPIACVQRCFGNEQFCETHFRETRRPYWTYKKTSSEALRLHNLLSNTDSETKSTGDLIKCYAKIQQAINQRNEFTDLYVWEESQDIGHRLFVQSLQSALDDCLARLHHLFDLDRQQKEEFKQKTQQEEQEVKEVKQDKDQKEQSNEQHAQKDPETNRVVQPNEEVLFERFVDRLIQVNELQLDSIEQMLSTMFVPLQQAADNIKRIRVPQLIHQHLFRGDDSSARIVWEHKYQQDTPQLYQEVIATDQNVYLVTNAFVDEIVCALQGNFAYLLYHVMRRYVEDKPFGATNHTLAQLTDVLSNCLRRLRGCENAINPQWHWNYTTLETKLTSNVDRFLRQCCGQEHTNNTQAIEILHRLLSDHTTIETQWLTDLEKKTLDEDDPLVSSIANVFDPICPRVSMTTSDRPVVGPTPIVHVFTSTIFEPIAYSIDGGENKRLDSFLRLDVDHRFDYCFKSSGNSLQRPLDRVLPIQQISTHWKVPSKPKRGHAPTYQLIDFVFDFGDPNRKPEDNEVTVDDVTKDSLTRRMRNVKSKDPKTKRIVDQIRQAVNHGPNFSRFDHVKPTSMSDAMFDQVRSHLIHARKNLYDHGSLVAVIIVGSSRHSLLLEPILMRNYGNNASTRRSIHERIKRLIKQHKANLLTMLSEAYLSFADNPNRKTDIVSATIYTPGAIYRGFAVVSPVVTQSDHSNQILTIPTSGKSRMTFDEFGWSPCEDLNPQSAIEYPPFCSWLSES